MPLRSRQQQQFIIGASALCLLYLSFELFFNAYAMFSVDEFWFAHRIYQYKDGLPYRDFAPYKTVLGYYLLLMPLLASKSLISALVIVKNALALLNTLILLGSSLWLRRYFSGKAILTSLVLLISSEVVLSYSTNIRVDLLGYWFCFFSLLFLLENRYLTAGLLLGLGFITTQKSIWYLFASNCALAIQWLCFQRNAKTLVNALGFNLVIGCVIASYIAFWAWMVDAHTVIASVFYEASAMYQLDWYASARKLFWSAITAHNPLLFLLWPLSLLSVVVTFAQDHNYQRRVFITAYAFTILCLLIPYKQVFPYYMQVTIPVFFILYIAFSDWLFAIFKPQPALTLLLGKNMLYAALALYIALVIGTVVKFELPEPYLIICLIPLLLGIYLVNYASLQQQFSALFFNLILISMIFMGGVYPMVLFTTNMINLNSGYQKANINAINTLLQDGSDYLAGIEFIYNKTQPIAGMRHLMGPAINYLYQPSDKLRTVMLASLYADPNATVDTVIADLKLSSVKFYVNNYRMQALPDSIQHYLASEYTHWWGSIYLYAPEMAAGKKSLTLRFSGKYMLTSPNPATVSLNGKHYKTNDTLYLNKGHYRSQANTSYRLKLIPEDARLLTDPAYANDESDKIIF